MKNRTAERYIETMVAMATLATGSLKRRVKTTFKITFTMPERLKTRKGVRESPAVLMTDAAKFINIDAGIPIK